MKKIKDFFVSVKKEISKVKWPTKKDMIKYSVITAMFIVFFDLFFVLLDFIIAYVKVLVG